MWKEMQRIEKVAETEGGDVRELGEMEQQPRLRPFKLASALRSS